MRNGIVKLLSLTLAVITLLSVLLLPAAAYTAPITNPMLDSYVVDDLTKMKYNVDNYPRDPSATHLQVIHFLEYGYSRTGGRFYGLYLYLYNPCGKEIELEGSYLQMSYGSGSTDYAKYPCTVVSYSVDESNKFVFYKLRVNGVSGIRTKLNSASRVYNLANLEVLYKGESKATTKSWERVDKAGSYKNTWTYQGFQKDFGSDSHTLSYTVDEFDTIPVEMHDASWLSDTSSLGDDYRWEVKSYYFNIPISYILKYGDITNEPYSTDGLYAVTGEYYKYGLNGCIRPSSSDSDKFYVGCNSTTTGFISHTNYDISYNMPLKDDYFEHITSDFIINKLCLTINDDSANVSNDVIFNVWKLNNKPIISNSRDLFIGEHLSNIGERVDFTVSVTGNDLASSIKTYASTKKDGFGKWLDKLFNKELYSDETGYIDCKPLVQVTDLKEYTEAAYVGKELYLDYNSYLGLKNFYKEKAISLSDGLQANNIYLMRLAVEPYYCSKANSGYYFEKVIHKDTDIFSFTFRRADGSLITVPVDCDPVDNLGSVVAGSNKDNSNPNGYPDDPSAAEIAAGIGKNIVEFFQSLKGIVVLIGLSAGSLIIFILVVVFWKYLEPWFRRAGNFLGKLGRGLGGVLGFFGKLIFNAFKLVWNIGFTVLFYFTGLDLRISGGFDFGSGKTERRDYSSDEHRWKAEEEQRKRDRHNWEMEEEQRKRDRHGWAGSEEVRKGVRFGWEHEEEQRKRDRHDWAGSEEVRKGVRLGFEHDEELRKRDLHKWASEDRKKSNNPDSSKKKDNYAKARRALKKAIDDDKSTHYQWNPNKPSYGDAEDYFNAAVKRSYEDLNKKE